MENYLILKDPTTLKDKALSQKKTVIEPILFEVADSLSSGNDLTLKLPYNKADDIQLGDIVYLPDKDRFIGGQLLSREIDKKKNTVTYKGLSGRGLLTKMYTAYGLTWNGYENQSLIQGLSFYDPEGSRASYYNSGDGTQQCKYNIVKAMQALEEFWELPIYFRENEYISQATFEAIGSNQGDYYEIKIPTAYTDNSFDFIRNYYEYTYQKAKLTSISGYLYGLEFEPRATHTYLITDENVKYAQSYSINLTSAASKACVYYATDGTIKASMKNKISQMPNIANVGLKVYPSRITNYDGTDEMKDKLRIDSAQSPITMTIDKLDPSKLSDADVGDLVSFYDADFDIQSGTKIITEKLYTLQNGEVKITYNIGG